MEEFPVPHRVAARLRPDERILVTMPAAQGAGLAVTTDRLIRWRPPGAALSVEFASIRRVDLRDETADREAALAIHCAGAQATVTIPLDDRHLPWISEAMAVIAAAVIEAGRAARRPVRLVRERTAAGQHWTFEPIPGSGLAGRLSSAPRIDPGWDDLRNLLR